MALTPGTRLGIYEVTAQIGEGGMGQVYRATDTRLKRQVAIKVLPPALAADQDRLARFQREAEVLASLNHPHIAAIYGLEESAGVVALVMELVEGDDLSQIIAQHASPEAKSLRSRPRDSEAAARRAGGAPRSKECLEIDTALAIARQIADALEAAHEQGIIHRDLKPANIKVRADGTVKVLDFGLAKAMERPAGSSPSMSMSPTITTPAMTQAGMILGTAAYMAPEQAKGRPVDKRADVWAFGAVLYEMLTGTRAFGGDDVQETFVAILRDDPDWSALPADTPAHIRTLLRHCLQKEPQKRLPHISLARFEIDEGPRDAGQNGLKQPPALVAPHSLWKRAIPLAAAALAAAAATSIIWWTVRPSTPRQPVTRFSFSLPEGQQFTSTALPVLAISPDGTQMVWVANNRLYLKSMSESDARPIPDTDSPTGLSTPVFSPDGQWIAFFSNGTLKKIAVAGGSAVTIGQADDVYGMSWGDGGLVYGQGTKGVMRVSASGGTAERLVTGKDGELDYGPQVLPGGTSLLFTIASGPSAELWDKARVVVQSIGGNERKTILTGGSDARYLPTGHVVYALGGILMAVPFDLERLEITGSPTPVVDGVRRSTGGPTGASHASISSTGSLVYLPGPASAAAAQQDIGLTDRKGVVQPLNLPAALYEYPRASPDGKRITFGTDDGKEANVWIYEMDGRSSTRRLTFGGRNKFPIWSADGRRVSFQSDREGDLGIWWQAADGTGAAERLTKAEPRTSHVPNAWSPANGPLLYTVSESTLRSSLWMLSAQDRKALPFGGVQSKGGTVIAAAFSPRGEWVAYSTSDTDDAGGNNVYVQPFPATGAKYQISKPGENGHHAVWSPAGNELFYVPQVGQFVVVTVTTQPGFSFGNPLPVARAFAVAAPTTPRPFDVTPDGRILSIIVAGQTRPGSALPQIDVVLNWFEELKSRVPTK